MGYEPVSDVRMLRFDREIVHIRLPRGYDFGDTGVQVALLATFLNPGCELEALSMQHRDMVTAKAVSS